MFYDDAFENVGHVLATVRGILEEIQYLFPLDDGDGVAFLLEQATERCLVYAIGFVLQPVDLHRGLGDSLLSPERLQGDNDLIRRGLASLASSRASGRTRSI